MPMPPMIRLARKELYSFVAAPQTLVTNMMIMAKIYTGRLPQILANGFRRKSERPMVRMSHAVDWERISTVMLRVAATMTKPGESMGP